MTEQAEGPVVRVSEGDGWETRTTCGRTPPRDREREVSTPDDLIMQHILSQKVVFGLAAQGHIPTIERMLAEGKSWQEIGAAIGWCPETAKRHYEWHLNKARGEHRKQTESGSR